eukprot:TRINITY_DN12989_c0_g1_i1.p1 TRINITY_DN12989_c0_g1~~TRINITY_DN12989_c0_g1_i1.p1  ORF type:complete len:115 (-),score=21.33 TRINITY_DN12989_c0_g1_i1:688-1032(-)
MFCASSSDLFRVDVQTLNYQTSFLSSHLSYCQVFMLIWRYILFFFLMIRRPPRSTHCISSAASDVYKRQAISLNFLKSIFKQKMKFTIYLNVWKTNHKNEKRKYLQFSRSYYVN